MSSTLQNADKANDLAEVMEVAAELGAQDAANLTKHISKTHKADSLNKAMKVAKETITAGEDGTKQLDSSSLNILSSTLQNADQADSLAAVVEVAAGVGAQDVTNLTSSIPKMVMLTTLTKWCQKLKMLERAGV